VAAGSDRRGAEPQRPALNYPDHLVCRIGAHVEGAGTARPFGGGGFSYYVRTTREAPNLCLASSSFAWSEGITLKPTSSPSRPYATLKYEPSGF
jgi:hypothetical protein